MVYHLKQRYNIYCHGGIYNTAGERWRLMDSDRYFCDGEDH
jgi:hypothetical protein